MEAGGPVVDAPASSVTAAFSEDPADGEAIVAGTGSWTGSISPVAMVLVPSSPVVVCIAEEVATTSAVAGFPRVACTMPTAGGPLGPLMADGTSGSVCCVVILGSVVGIEETRGWLLVKDRVPVVLACWCILACTAFVSGSVAVDRGLMCSGTAASDDPTTSATSEEGSAGAVGGVSGIRAVILGATAASSVEGRGAVSPPLMDHRPAPPRSSTPAAIQGHQARGFRSRSASSRSISVQCDWSNAKSRSASFWRASSSNPFGSFIGIRSLRYVPAPRWRWHCAAHGARGKRATLWCLRSGRASRRSPRG